MHFSALSNNIFRLNIYNSNIKDIDIFDYNDIKSFIYKILKKYINKYNLKGILTLDIYIDDNYGMIIDIKKKDNNYLKEYVEMKIIFHLDTIFLYKIDYFNIIENINIKNQKIYYYKDNFYLEIINDIDDNEYIKLLELSDIIYNNHDDILKKGIELFI